MVEAVQVLWPPSAISMPSLGARAFVDTTDGDTPNVSMPVRMLSVDTPEVTADTPAGAGRVDAKLKQLAEWIDQGKAPISPRLAEHLRPKLGTGSAGTLQFDQGKKASDFADRNIRTRLARPGKDDRRIFIRSADPHFDDNGRLLAYIAPNFTAEERAALPREQRSTFNLDLLAAGWAAPFVIYPAIPGELDLPLLITATEKAMAAAATNGNIWSDPNTLLAYEYRMMEKLHSVTRKIVDGKDLSPAERFSWRERYCADMRSRVLHGPEDYMSIPPQYRLWFWPRDVQRAIGDLNLVPSRKLVHAE
jgi:endonuclease YncB( thermonuclease family)